jgi:multiple sugar transport system permease protein
MPWEWPEDRLAGPLSATGRFAIFLAMQCFLTLPAELAEAARVDGCRELQVFWRIYLPLAKPLLVIETLFAFQTAWLDFLWPLIVAKGPSLYTLQVGPFCVPAGVHRAVGRHHGGSYHC